MSHTGKSVPLTTWGWLRDQAAYLRDAGSTLYDDELVLLGDVRGERVLHTLCNARQEAIAN